MKEIVEPTTRNTAWDRLHAAGEFAESGQNYEIIT